MSNVLLVEDLPEYQYLVTQTLHGRHHLTCAHNVKEALEKLQADNFDVVLLDIALPDGDGFQLLSELQGKSPEQVPAVIFLTGKTGTDDKIRGFSLGAYDYIVKPFEPRELLARLEAHLKRANRDTQGETLRKGNILIDRIRQKAFLIQDNDKEEVDLTTTEFRLLQLFLKNEGSIFTREQLIKEAWFQDTHVVKRTIDRHICTLRKKLDDSGRYIVTVPGKGYLFRISPQSDAL